MVAFVCYNALMLWSREPKDSGLPFLLCLILSVLTSYYGSTLFNRTRDFGHVAVVYLGAPPLLEQ